MLSMGRYWLFAYQLLALIRTGSYPIGIHCGGLTKAFAGRWAVVDLIDNGVIGLK